MLVENPAPGIPKYIIFDGGRPRKKLQPGQTYLRLVASDLAGMGVKLVACDENGIKMERGNLIAFREDGRVEALDSVNERANLELTNGGYLNITRFT